jgi:hypothetical protein
MTILKLKLSWFALAGGAALSLVVLTLPVFASASHNDEDASLSGAKTVIDEDGDERNFQGWPIRLYDEDGELLDTDTTDARGEYMFEGLEAGTYRVCEGSGSGFDQTFPRTSASTAGDPDVEVIICPGNTVGYEVELGENEEKDGLDFRNEERAVASTDLRVACAAGPAITVSVGQRVTFGAATNRLTPALFEWSGDVSGMGQSISTVFATPGTRTATITATDGDDRARSTCSVTVLAAAVPTPGGVGGAPGETPVAQAPTVTPPAETETDEQTDETTSPADEEADEAAEGESAEGTSAARDNLWWIVLAVIVIALAGYYFWERQRGTGMGAGKPEKKEGGTPPPPASPAQQ